MTVDLAGPRATAEATLTAMCSIVRDEQGAGDDVLDEDTLELAPPDPDTTAVYTGACSVRPIAARGAAEEGGADVYRHTYLVLLPVDADPAIGDLITVTASDDSVELGRELVVVEVAHSSRAILRRVTAVDRRTGPRT